MKKAYVYYSEAFPGYEYEVVPFEDLENQKAKIGEVVSVKHGAAKSHGILKEIFAVETKRKDSILSGLESLVLAVEQVENLKITSTPKWQRGNANQLNNISNKYRERKKKIQDDRRHLYEMVTIGPNRSKIRKEFYNSIDWDSYTAATRSLLMEFFSRETLSSSNLTGRPSPAFQHVEDMEKKDILDPLITTDIIEVVSMNCGVEKSRVRAAITSKCADETKLRRLRDKRRFS